MTGEIRSRQNSGSIQGSRRATWILDCEPEEIMRRHFRTIAGIVFLAAWVVAAAPEPGLKSALDTIKPAADPRSHQGPRVG